MKILHAPVNIGNQPWVLSRHERNLGVKSDLVVNYGTWLKYPADKILGDYGSKTVKNYARRIAYGLMAPMRYDVLHYYFGRSLLHWHDYGFGDRLGFFDLKLGQYLGRKIFFTLQGCDVRLAEPSNKRNAVTMCRAGGCSAFESCIAHLDSERRSFIDTILPRCQRVFFLNPELGHYVPKGNFLPYANVAVEEVSVGSAVRNRRPRVLHAPSDENIKGTALIERALKRLKGHYDFEYIAVRNMPHEQAMKLYANADLVIDQVLAGWYGGFAVELMAMAKPVVCFLRESDFCFLPPGMRNDMPLLRVESETLEEDLARIFDRQSEWRDLGVAARQYVLKWHNPNNIAAAMVAAYRDPRSRFVLADHL